MAKVKEEDYLITKEDIEPSTTVALYIKQSKLDTLDDHIEKLNNKLKEDYEAEKKKIAGMTATELRKLKTKMKRLVDKREISIAEANRRIRKATEPKLLSKPKKYSRTTVIEKLIQDNL